MSQKQKMLIGIDTGVNTGFAVWNTDKRKFEEISSSSIIVAMEKILAWKPLIKLVIVEDARQVKYKTSKWKAQGAGSVKRDCGIWEEFLNHHGIKSKFVRPNPKITKIKAATFRRITAHQGSTNEHGRDAAMLIYNFKG